MINFGHLLYDKAGSYSFMVIDEFRNKGVTQKKKNKKIEEPQFYFRSDESWTLHPALDLVIAYSWLSLYSLISNIKKEKPGSRAAEFLPAPGIIFLSGVVTDPTGNPANGNDFLAPSQLRWAGGLELPYAAAWRFFFPPSHPTPPSYVDCAIIE